MLPYLSDRTLLILGALLCVIAAWYTTGYHHPDEHFQIWEFAHYKMGRISSSSLPWEFPAQMRPGLQPFLAYSVIRTFEVLGFKDPFLQVFFTRLACGLAALWVYWSWTRWLSKDFINPHSIRWMRIGLLFFWLMPYLNVRFSSENTSAICFFGGLLVLLKALEGPNGRKPIGLLTAGLLLGLSFFFRYQIAFAGIGLGAWLIWLKRPNLSAWFWLITGALISLFIGLAADVWLYDDWVFAPYNYFFSNIVEGKAATFGVSPFWWYFTELPVALVPPLSVVLLLLAGYGIYKRPSHVFSWILIPFVLVHSMVAHKEVRFLFPMAITFFFFAAAGWEAFAAHKKVSAVWLRGFQALLIINALLLVSRIFIPAKELAAYAKFLWYWAEKHPESTVYFVKPAPVRNYPLNMPFYIHPNQIQQSWYTDDRYHNDTSTLNTGDVFFFTNVMDPKPQAPPGFELNRVYHYYPDWVRQNNANDWQSRTRIYEAYTLTRKGQ
jgi:phosphatidylinositol glycan class B